MLGKEVELAILHYEGMQQHGLYIYKQEMNGGCGAGSGCV